MKIIYFVIYMSLKIYKKATRISHNITWKNKIKKLIRTKGSKKLAKAHVDQIALYYKKYKIKGVRTEWHRFYYDCNTTFSVAYVPENLFYIDIEPKLNQEVYFPSFADKNILAKMFTAVKQPETVVKNINGFYYANGELIEKKEALYLCDKGERLVIKPSVESGGGKNIVLFTSKNELTDTGQKLSDLFAGYQKDFIVQKVVLQHELLKSLNPTSLNTIRIMTYLNENKVDVLSTIIRIGRKGSNTDNATTGGISCGIQKNGQMNSLGYQLSGTSFSATDSGIKFKDVKLNFIPQIVDTVDELHKEVPFFKLVSWDLAVDNIGNIVLIEYNVMGQGINSHQLNNGPVLAPLLKTLNT